MVVTAYNTVTLGIKNALRDLIRTTTSFERSTYLDYIVAPTDYDVENPLVIIRLVSDVFKAIGAMETEHCLTFRLEMDYMSGYEEDDLDKVIGYVGEIVDVIEASRDLDAGSYVRNTEIRSINYSYQEGESAILRKAELIVEVENIRNV